MLQIAMFLLGLHHASEARQRFAGLQLRIFLRLVGKTKPITYVVYQSPNRPSINQESSSGRRVTLVGLFADVASPPIHRVA